MHLAPLIQDIAVILLIASVVNLIFQKIHQPMVLGYLVAGILVGPHTPPFAFVTDTNGIAIWSELGVIFLMFALGLEFNLEKLKSTGKTALITGPLEVVVMLILGFFTGKLLGFSSLNCIFLGAILSISSTTVIIKSLDEMRLKKEIFAQTIFGILIVEDLVGILILVGLSTLSDDGGFSGVALLLAALKLMILVAIAIGVGLYTVPRFIDHIGEKASDETLVVLSLGLCLGLVLVAVHFHYSTALGAFIMGCVIAESKQSHRIEKLLTPFKDVFGAIFFVSIGMLLNPSEILENWKSIAIISVVTILGKISSTFIGVRLSGQSRRVAMQSGFALAQIGEFSFIIAALGLSLGKMDPILYVIAVSVAVVTTFTTPYLIRYSVRN